MKEVHKKVYKISQRLLKCFISALFMICIISSFSYATELTIGIIPENDVFEQVERYRSLGQYIEKKTGIKINYTIISRYGNIVEKFNQRNLDGAFWGSMTGAMAIRQLDMEPIVRQVDLDNASSHTGYIFVHKYSVIDGVDRMKDVEIAFVDKATATGYLFPLSYLRKGGVDNIDEYFKKSHFTGSHKDTIEAVFERRVDIGCADNIVFDMMSRENPRIKEDLVIIAKSPELPSTSLGIKKEIPLALREDLKRVLIEMKGSTEGMKILGQFGARQFIETTENDYKAVFNIATGAGLDLKKYKYSNK